MTTISHMVVAVNFDTDIGDAWEFADVPYYPEADDRARLSLRHQLRHLFDDALDWPGISTKEKSMNRRYIVDGVLSLFVFGSALAMAQQGQQKGPPPPMSFFVTSVGAGKGANLGGLSGADAHCQKLAGAAGAGNRTWHAYLSTSPSGDKPGLNARDRIGQGPWFNAKGQRVAKNLSDLHGDTLEEARVGNTLTKATALTEKGDRVNGFGDTPNQHDILTGSQPDGTAYPDSADHTCGNWTAAKAQAPRNSATSTAPAGRTHPGTPRIPAAAAARKIW